MRTITIDVTEFKDADDAHTLKAEVQFSYGGAHLGEVLVFIDTTGVLLSLRGPEGGSKGYATAGWNRIKRAYVGAESESGNSGVDVGGGAGENR